jgi:predicted nucleic acid-binding protein
VSAKPLVPANSYRGFLLDTSVISALAPGREAYLSVPFGDWLQAHNQQLFLPAIAVAELAQGIGKLRRSGAVDRAQRLDLWLDGLIAGFADRILPLDAQAARLAGQISDVATAGGKHPGFADVAIAALAQNANLLLLTVNIKHFQPIGTNCVNPFVQLPTETA